jgi:hypothetical protein
VRAGAAARTTTVRATITAAGTGTTGTGTVAVVVGTTAPAEQLSAAMAFPLSDASGPYAVTGQSGRVQAQLRDPIGLSSANGYVARGGRSAEALGEGSTASLTTTSTRLSGQLRVLDASGGLALEATFRAARR